MLNQRHGTGYPDITGVPLPPDRPTNATAATDWDDFRQLPSWARARWQGFLAGRYRRNERLRDASEPSAS